MPPRRGADIGRGRPKENAVMLEEIHTLHTMMDIMETAQRITPDERDASAVEESYEEEEEENETTKVTNMLAKVGGKPNVEILVYEKVDDKKNVKFVVTRLKGHAAIW